MDQNVLLFTILGLTFVIALTQVFILLLGNSKNAQPDSDMPDDSLSPYSEKSLAILHDAARKANKILSNAELKGIEFISRQKLEMSNLNKELETQILTLQEKLIAQYKNSLNRSEQSYTDFLSTLAENLKQQELQNQKLFQEKTQKLIESNQQIMSAFIMDINAKVKRQIDEEFKLVKNELDTYKKHRLEVINKNIIDILERTLENTLLKKLNLTEHTEIIFHSLEEAKQEHSL